MEMGNERIFEMIGTYLDEFFQSDVTERKGRCAGVGDVAAGRIGHPDAHFIARTQQLVVAFQTQIVAVQNQVRSSVKYRFLSNPNMTLK